MPKMRRQPSLAYTVASAALVAALVFVGYVTYTAAFPGEAIVLLRPMHVRPAAGAAFIAAGQPVSVEFDYCKTSRQHATVGVYLITPDDNPTIVPIGTYVTSLPLGCRKARMLLQLPAYVPPGTYLMGHTREYRASAVEHKTYQFLSDPFFVSKMD